MLQCSSLIIVPLEKKHLTHLRVLRNDETTYVNLTFAGPVSEASQLQWYQTVSTDPSKMYFSILNTAGSFIGFVRCDEWDKINQSIRLGIDIVPRMRRKGYATKTYAVMFDYLFGHLNIHRIWLLVADYNKPAIALYKKIGFRREGFQKEALFRFGRYHDYIAMSFLKKDYDAKK